VPVCVYHRRRHVARIAQWCSTARSGIRAAPAARAAIPRGVIRTCARPAPGVILIPARLDDDRRDGGGGQGNLDLAVARLLHLLKKSISSNVEPGRRYDVFKIDYGCYVDLINTSRAPGGLFQGEGELFIRANATRRAEVRSKVSAMSPSRTGRCCDVAIGDSHWPKISCLFQLTPLGCGVASSADREQASHASSARAGRSRQCESKWAGSTRLVHQNGAGNSAVSASGTTSPRGSHRFLGRGACSSRSG